MSHPVFPVRNQKCKILLKQRDTVGKTLRGSVAGIWARLPPRQHLLLASKQYDNSSQDFIKVLVFKLVHHQA